jgi:hypothetical protein
MMHHSLALLAAVALLAAPLAPPEVEEALQRVRSISSKVAAAPAAGRAELLDDAIRERARLIAMAPDDHRVATWLLDQADAIVSRAGADGGELSVLYGVPTPAQRTRVLDAATEARRLIERARAAIDRGVADLERELFEARADAARAQRVAAETEPRMRVLIDVEQGWRAPMIDARAVLALLAATDAPTGGAGAAERRRRAAEVGETLDALQAPDDAGECSRLLLVATALNLAGEFPEAAARFTEAAAPALTPDEMAQEQSRLGALASAPSLAAARELARVAAPAGEDGPMSLLLLRAEVAARAVLWRAPDDATRAAVQRDALTPLSLLVRRSLREQSDAPTAGAFAELLCEKVLLVTEGAPRVEPAALDAPITCARGMALLAGRVAGTSVPGDRAARMGEELLDRVIADEAAPPEVRAAAMWTLGTREVAADRARLDAAVTLTRLAGEFPDAPRATPALKRADGLLRDVMRSRDVAALGPQRELIELWLARTPGPDQPLADDLRSLAIANLALDYAASVDFAMLERVLRRLPEWPDAQRARREADELNASIVLDRQIARHGAPAERERIARLAAEWATDRASPLAPRYRLALADALLGTGDAKGAIRALAPLTGPATEQLTPAERTHARLVLGLAQRRSADSAAAFATLRALADELDREPSAPPSGAESSARRAPAFWIAWAEMLEILDAENTGGERTGAIRLQVNRLRLIDPGLGGGATKGRIEAVAARLK